MALTTGDKAECKELAREIIQEVLKQHISSCPWGKKLVIGKALLIGVAIGSGAASGGAAFVLLRALLGT